MVDRDERVPVDHRMGGETRHAQVVVDVAAVGRVQTPAAAEQRAGVVGRRAQRAGEPPVGAAVGAFPAARQEGHHDPLARYEVVDPLTQRLHPAGRLVAEQHRRRADAVAVQHRQIGVTQTGGLDADQHLAGARRVEFHLLDPDRSGPGVRPAPADLGEDGSLDLHQ
ncbi:hypothetical protein SDC9_205696 [bioreactor metagenome]|uniref:Uncharacterized protein n=1 Tax=bioreactor metagenome TaxID=1076179 RepID=A0A645J4D7_9ZZZZ